MAMQAAKRANVSAPPPLAPSPPGQPGGVRGEEESGGPPGLGSFRVPGRGSRSPSRQGSWLTRARRVCGCGGLKKGPAKRADSLGDVSPKI